MVWCACSDGIEHVRRRYCGGKSDSVLVTVLAVGSVDLHVGREPGGTGGGAGRNGCQWERLLRPRVDRRRGIRDRSILQLRRAERHDSGHGARTGSCGAQFAEHVDSPRVPHRRRRRIISCPTTRSSCACASASARRVEVARRSRLLRLARSATKSAPPRRSWSGDRRHHEAER